MEDVQNFHHQMHLCFRTKRNRVNNDYSAKEHYYIYCTRGNVWSSHLWWGATYYKKKNNNKGESYAPYPRNIKGGPIFFFNSSAPTNSRTYAIYSKNQCHNVIWTTVLDFTDKMSLEVKGIHSILSSLSLGPTELALPNSIFSYWPPPPM